MAIVKGYPVSSGYMGYMEDEDKYILFDTEDEYLDLVREMENQEES